MQQERPLLQDGRRNKKDRRSRRTLVGNTFFFQGLVWNPLHKNIAMRRCPYFDHEQIKILRVVEGVAVYFVLSTLLKLPFSADFLGSGTLPALLVRCARYAIISFVAFGIYPMGFRLIDRVGKPKAQE